MEFCRASLEERQINIRIILLILKSYYNLIVTYAKIKLLFLIKEMNQCYLLN